MLCEITAESAAKTASTKGGRLSMRRCLLLKVTREREHDILKHSKSQNLDILRKSNYTSQSPLKVSYLLMIIFVRPISDLGIGRKIMIS